MFGSFSIARSTCYDRNLRFWMCGAVLLGLVLCTLGGNAHGQTADLQVVATVEASCRLRGGTLNFGAYRSQESKTAQTSISYDCPPGMEISLTLSPGRQPQGQERAMLRDDGDDLLTYQLYQDSARSQVWGEQGDALTIESTADGGTDVDVYGRIEAGQAVPPGTYRDTVLITLVVH